MSCPYFVSWRPAEGSRVLVGCSSITAARHVFENHVDIYDAAAPGGGAYIFDRGRNPQRIQCLDHCQGLKDPKQCTLYDKANYNKYIKSKK